jgi:hypothetical protein
VSRAHARYVAPTNVPLGFGYTEAAHLDLPPNASVVVYATGTVFSYPHTAALGGLCRFRIEDAFGNPRAALGVHEWTLPAGGGHERVALVGAAVVPDDDVLGFQTPGASVECSHDTGFGAAHATDFQVVAVEVGDIR